MSEFLTLPVELLVEILSVLDIQSLLRCRQICRFLQNVIDNAADLQYKIYLVVACMEDGPPSELGSSQRLSALKNHQNAWRNLVWREEISVSALYGNAWELLGGVLGLLEDDPGKSLVFRRLPSRFRGIEDVQWTIKDIGFKVQDFTIDTSQDLLVAIEVLGDTSLNSTFRVHLRSLASGDPHPMAVNTSVLPFIPKFRSHNWRYTMQIYANRVAVHFQLLGGEGESELSIWNWTTGELELWLFGIELTETFSFLTYNLMAVGYNHPNGSGPQLRIYDIDHTSGQVAPAARATYLCSFDCPAFSSWAFRYDIELFIQTEPVFSHHSPNVPFYPSQSNRLLVLTYVKAVTRGVCVLLVVPISTLLDQINRKGGETQRQVSWAEWGPSGTRIMALSPSDIWVCYVHCMKFVVLNVRGELEMYDFNPLSLKRNLQSEEEMEEEDSSEIVSIDEAEDSESEGHVSVEYLTGPQVSNYKIFKEMITTSLPCQRTTTSLPRRSTEKPIAVMLTDDSLVIVEPERAGGRAFRILSF